jgi:glutathione S-transferase
MGLFQLMMAKEKAAFETAKESIDQQLARFAQVARNTPWFNGEDFSMVDIAAAPIAVRLDIIKTLTQVDFLSEYANLALWFEQLLQRETVQASYVPELKDILAMRMQGNKSYIYVQ